MSTLAVVGAGAKAVAVAAKAAVLREMGVQAPEVVAVERTEVAANWRASGGWTDGAHRLGTGPEKDVQRGLKDKVEEFFAPAVRNVLGLGTGGERGARPVHQLDLQRGPQVLRQRVVVTVACGPRRGGDTGVDQALGEPQRRVLPGFNRSLQHRVVGASVVVRRTLRRGFR